MNCPICNHPLDEGADIKIRMPTGETTSETWGPAHYWCPRCELPFAKDRVHRLAAGEWPLREGDRVLIDGPPGKVEGVVLHASTPFDMPHLGPGSASHEAHQIMHEYRVDFVALIGHRHNDREQCFFAMRHPGGWRDLRGQDLTITKIEEQGNES